MCVYRHKRASHHHWKTDYEKISKRAQARFERSFFTMRFSVGRVLSASLHQTQRGYHAAAGAASRGKDVMIVRPPAEPAASTVQELFDCIGLISGENGFEVSGNGLFDNSPDRFFLELADDVQFSLRFRRNVNCQFR
jgi:hypothetical protein